MKTAGTREQNKLELNCFHLIKKCFSDPSEGVLCFYKQMFYVGSLKPGCGTEGTILTNK